MRLPVGALDVVHGCSSVSSRVGDDEEMKSAASSENTLTLILDSVTIATSVFLHVRIHVLKTKFCLSEAAKKNQSALSSIKSLNI